MHWRPSDHYSCWLTAGEVHAFILNKSFSKDPQLNSFHENGGGTYMREVYVRFAHYFRF